VRPGTARLDEPVERPVVARFDVRLGVLRPGVARTVERLELRDGVETLGVCRVTPRVGVERDPEAGLDTDGLDTEGRDTDGRDTEGVGRDTERDGAGRDTEGVGRDTDGRETDGREPEEREPRWASASVAVTAQNTVRIGRILRSMVTSLGREGRPLRNYDTLHALGRRSWNCNALSPWERPTAGAHARHLSCLRHTANRTNRWP